MATSSLSCDDDDDDDDAAQNESDASFDDALEELDRSFGTERKEVHMDPAYAPNLNISLRADATVVETEEHWRSSSLVLLLLGVDAICCWREANDVRGSAIVKNRVWRRGER